jgi:beta-mannosidase
MLYSAEILPITDWELGSCAPGELPAEFQQVRSARTVAGAWSEWGVLDLDDRSTIERIDGQDHYWRTSLPKQLYTEATLGRQVILDLPGLATIAEIRLNGSTIGESNSMFVPLQVDLTNLLGGSDTLEIVIRSLTSFLDATKWARPRWKTRLVSDQRLRNVRTALIGRVGWAPPTPVAGPYAGARVLIRNGNEVYTRSVQTRLEGDVGFVSAEVQSGPNVRVGIEVGSTLHWLESRGDGRWFGEVRIDDVAKWFPHTHGTPELHSLFVILANERNDQVTRIPVEPVGFRSVTVDETDGGFRVAINGIPVFCRGAVAMPFDVVGVNPEPAVLRSILETFVFAGMNMIRLGGTNWYESTELHQLCDELGILVWQDLPFASLDYPSTPEFQETVTRELEFHMRRLRSHPSTAIVCGSSEAEQQAAMMGNPPEIIAQTPGKTWIRELATTLAPELHFVSSSPTGGHLPMRVDTGISHYFGVGAYQRTLDDATLSGVRFASECLAFANLPSPSVRQKLGPFEGEFWKSRVPRDSGSVWDFDDVRDHYVRTLTGESISVKTSDPEHWFELSNVIPGEVMASTFRTWRTGAVCAGGLILSLNDVWPSAGWGLLDCAGVAKASLQRLAQVLQPLALLAVDRGLNGLDLHLINDTPSSFEGILQVRAVDSHGRALLKGTRRLCVDGHQSLVVPAEAVLGRFGDPTYAYRFGAQPFDAIVAVFSRELPEDDVDDLDSAFAHAMHVITPQWAISSAESTAESVILASVSEIPRGARITLAGVGVNRFISVSADGAVASTGQIDLGPNQRKSIDLVWPEGYERPSTGRLRVLCPNQSLDFGLPPENRL